MNELESNANGRATCKRNVLFLARGFAPNPTPLARLRANAHPRRRDAGPFPCPRRRGRGPRWVIVVMATLLALATDGLAGPPATTPSATVPMLERADDVASYTLRAKLDPVAHTIHGEGTITWKNASTKP